jgi:4-oxalocrotonate tautomerase
MPFLHIRIAPRRGAAVDTAALACDFTRLAADVLGKRADLTSVRVERVEPGDWFIDGVPGDRRLATGHVQIQVTQGTNTPAEKAAFVGRAYERLAATLGPLHPASYVVVQEIPADAWGYGGRTQAARRLEAEAAATAAVP